MPTGIDYLDETWNPITGCTPISPGCANCWAKVTAERLKLCGCKKYMHDDPFAVRFHPDELDKPLHWEKPRRIGVSFMGDWMHKDVRMDWQLQILATMERAKQHTFFTLTKRPKGLWDVIAHLTRVNHDLNALAGYRQRGVPCLPNLYNGITAEDQPRLDERAPQLLKIPGKHWLSAEPLLGPMNIADAGFLPFKTWSGIVENDARCGRCGTEWEDDLTHECPPGFGPTFDWVVVGCESGKNRRPCKLEWIVDIVNQFKDAGVPCFVKQVPVPKVDALALLDLRDGHNVDLWDRRCAEHGWRMSKNPAEWPESIRVQEMPK